MKKPAKVILGAFSVFVIAWAALSAYFTVAGLDLRDDSFREYSPGGDYHDRARALPPEKNALTHLKWLEENMPTNTTLTFSNYQLKRAYLDGTTNRLALAGAAQELIAAESNTFACAARLLDCEALDVPRFETAPVWHLTRILDVSRVKAVFEASQGDVDKGRQTLMGVVKIGVMVMDNESHLAGISQLVGYTIVVSALDTASQPLFVNGDEEWRGSLRQHYRDLLADDVDRVRLEAQRSPGEYWQLFGEVCSTNRAMVLGLALACGRAPRTNVLLQEGIGDVKAFSWLKWEGLERRFLTVFLTAFPGYVQYSLQPNRCLAMHRKACERLCRKVGEPYDVEYAGKSDFGRGDGGPRDFNPLHRNWLGEIMMARTLCRDAYRLLFRHRFEVNARIVASACQSHKAKHGAFPARLDDLVPEFLPEIPRDPYDGEPLRYNSEKLYLWTPGESLSFDGKVKLSRNGKPITDYRVYRCVYFIPDAN